MNTNNSDDCSSAVAHVTIVQNLQVHFLVDPPVECKDQSAYDHFIEYLHKQPQRVASRFLNQKIQTGDDHYRGIDDDDDDGTMNANGRQLLVRVMNNVFHSDREAHTLTYMRKCVMRMVEWAWMSAAADSSSSSLWPHRASNGSGNTSRIQSALETDPVAIDGWHCNPAGLWKQYVDLLLQFVPGENSPSEKEAHVGLENVLHIQAMRSLAALLTSAAEWASHSVGCACNCDQCHMLDALYNGLQNFQMTQMANGVDIEDCGQERSREQLSPGLSILNMVFDGVIGKIDNGYVRDAAGELLAAYWFYCCSSRSPDDVQGSDMMQSAFEQRLAERYQSYPLQTQGLLMALTARAAQTDDPAMKLREFLSKIQAVDKYVLSGHILLTGTDRAVMRKSSEIIVQLSRIEDVDARQRIANGILQFVDDVLLCDRKPLAHASSIDIYRLEIVLDVIGCCDSNVIADALSGGSILLSLIYSVCNVLDECISVALQHQSSDLRHSKIVISAFQALGNCYQVLRPLFITNQELLDRLVSLILGCIGRYEWFHSSTNNRRVCIAGLDLLDQILVGSAGSVELLSDTAKSKVANQLHDMCAYEASINHSIIMLKSSVILAKLLLCMSPSVELQSLVQRYWTSILGGLLDMNWEVRDSTLQAIAQLCDNEIHYRHLSQLETSGTASVETQNSVEQLFPRKNSPLSPATIPRIPESGRNLTMLELLVLVHENGNAKIAQGHVENVVELVLQRLKDVDNYVKLTAIRTLDSMMSAGLLLFSEKQDGDDAAAADRRVSCTASLTRVVQDVLAEDDCGLMADFYVRRALFDLMDKWLQNAHSYSLDAITELLSVQFDSILNNCELEMYHSVLNLQLVLLRSHCRGVAKCGNLLTTLRVEDFVCDVLKSENNFSRETWGAMQSLLLWVSAERNFTAFATCPKAMSAIRRMQETKSDIEAHRVCAASGGKSDGRTGSGTTLFFTFESENLDCY